MTSEELARESRGEPVTAAERRSEAAADAAAEQAVAAGVPLGGAAVVDAELQRFDAEGEAGQEVAADEQAEEVAGGAMIAQTPEMVPARSAPASAEARPVDVAQAPAPSVTAEASPAIIGGSTPAEGPSAPATANETTAPQARNVSEAVNAEKSRTEPPVTPEPLHLERKHLLGIRWMHWVNFPVLFTMIWSGLLIYWNDSDNAYQYPHRVYRIGLGPVTLFRFFPDWFYTLIHAQFNVTKGLGYHFFFMWIFALNGILYVAFLLISKEWKFMVPDRKSLVEAIQVTLIDMRILKRALPFQTKYNGAQKIAYTSVLLMGAGSLLTGLAIYKPTSAHWLTQAMGGYEMARWLHFWLTMSFCAFFLVHVYQVAAAGWNNFRAMVTGYELRRASEPSLEAERRRF